ncbi:hypothetical protein [Streptomyces echinatus]|uniref:Uncharacterized protein n=1 Tax=Streptomyces echinatus TaxID=67293 RepID=A0A7W9Q2W3_9ACTN|nr:hypothetical protein [Streptomyces echinatus]MBB5932349.1 hypothetical protein [Streptomyces echinatus]
MTEKSALREQLTSAMIPVFAMDRMLLKPEELRIIDELVTAVLGVILPHGQLLGDQLRDAEQRLAETRTTLHEVLSHFVHKGHPGEPCLQTGWIAEKTVARWRAVLYPPAPDPAAGPTDSEAAAHDRRWPLEKEGE